MSINESSQCQLKVVNSGDEVEAKTKPFTPISITVRDDLETLEATDHILIENAISRQLSVLFLVFVGEGVLFAPFFGHLCLRMYLLQPLISAVG